MAASAHTRFSVYLPPELAARLDQAVENLKAQDNDGGRWSRNHAITTAVRQWLDMNQAPPTVPPSIDRQASS